MHDASSSFPRSLAQLSRHSGPVASRTCCDRASRADPFNAIATADLPAGRHPHLRRQPVHRRRRTARRHATTRGWPPPACRRGRASPPSCCTSSARSRWCSACGRCRCWPRSSSTHGWPTATHYVNDTVNYTEPLFVVVIMALASTRPIVTLAEAVAARARRPRRRHARRLVDRHPDRRAAARLVHHRAGGDDDRRAAAGAPVLRPQAVADAAATRTLGLLFVNVSIGGTLTHFAAPPVLMVARDVGLGHAVHARALRLARGHRDRRLDGGLLRCSSGREFAALAARRGRPTSSVAAEDAHAGQSLLPIPAWVTLVHLAFMAWTVVNAHYPALFIGGFLFFLGFTRATAAYQAQLDIKTPLLVGFFLAGLVIHGGLQGWWIAPGARRACREDGLFWGATVSDRVQRQRAHHLPRDARARPRRRVQDRRRRRRGDRRRPHGDRQRAESGRPGAARPVLRRRRQSDPAVRWRR